MPMPVQPASATLTSSRTQQATANQTSNGAQPQKGASEMAQSKSSMLTNSNARKEKAAKAGKCQICGEKTSGFSAIIDYDKGTVSVRKAKPGHAFYCKDHAEKKRKRYEWKLNRSSTKSTTGRGSRKQKRGAAKAKATPRKRTRRGSASGATKRTRTRTSKAKGSTTRKRAPRKTAAKTAPKRKRSPRKATAKTSGSGDPF